MYNQSQKNFIVLTILYIWSSFNPKFTNLKVSLQNELQSKQSRKYVVKK